MSETLLFAIGFALFALTTGATLLFGYRRFYEIYAADAAGTPAEAIDEEVVLVDRHRYPFEAAPVVR